MRMTNVFHAPDDGGAGGAVAVPDRKESFSTEYVAELRAEAQSCRAKVADLEAKLRDAQERMAKIEKEAEATTAEAVRNAEGRFIYAEAKAEALQAGLVDADALKLADLSNLAIEKDGTVKGIGEMLAALKKAKPYLFGSASTSGTATPPGKTPPEQKRATAMGAEEYAAAKKRLGIKH